MVTHIDLSSIFISLVTKKIPKSTHKIAVPQDNPTIGLSSKLEMEIFRPFLTFSLCVKLKDKGSNNLMDAFQDDYNNKYAFCRLKL